MENLGCDSLGDAVQTLLDKCFTLQNNGHRSDRQTDRQVADRWTDRQNDRQTSVLKVAAVWRKSSQISCIPSVSQVEFSRQEKKPQPTATAPFKHLATSAANTHTQVYTHRHTHSVDWHQINENQRLQRKTFKNPKIYRKF